MIDVKTIFKTRDKAISKKDRNLFLSTQAGELLNCSFEGYVSVGELHTEVLHVYQEKGDMLHNVVFVKENYIPKDKPSYASFVTYYLIDTKQGWKIYRLGY